MDMNRDGFIKKKFKEDTYISKQANDVFDKFEKSILSAKVQSENKIVGKVIQFNKDNSNMNDDSPKTNFNNMSNENPKTSENASFSENEKINSVRNQNSNLENLFYKRMNRVLSVAAVSLCALVVGTGTILYKRKPQTENVNIITKSISVRNEELRVSNEQIVREHENNLVKAMLTGDNEVAIQLKKDFMDVYSLNLSTEKQYKVNNINKKVKDIFVGNIISDKLPYVMLLMEDDTIEYVIIMNENANINGNYEFNFYSQGRVLGLYDVIGFEQQKRKFSYSDEYYYYINAVRKDGKRKEIELDNYNDWEDNEKKVYDKLNQKYIDAYEEKQKQENKAQTQTTTNKNGTNKEKSSEEKYKEKYKDKQVFTIPKDAACAYYIENKSLYKIDIATNTDKLMATGVVGYAINTDSGSMVVILYSKFDIIERDSNCIYRQYDANINSPIVETIQKYGVSVAQRKDGTITMEIEEGGLEKLGISKEETSIKENVIYNVYEATEGVYEGKMYRNADAKTFIFGDIGSNNTSSIVYLKNDGTVVCMDVVEMIKTSNVYRSRKVIKDLKDVEGFKEDILYKTEGNRIIEKYKTIWIIQRESDGTLKYTDLNYGD